MSSSHAFDFWRDKTVLVTGGAGFLGSHVIETLQQNGVVHVVVPRSAEYDLRDPAQTRALFETHRPDGVIHLAAVVGGIGANREAPGAFLHDNALMGTNVIEACRLFQVNKLVFGWHRVQLSGRCPVTVSRRGAMERLPGVNQRAVRTRQASVDRASQSVSTAVRITIDHFDSDQPVWSRRQFRPANKPCDSGNYLKDAGRKVG